MNQLADINWALFAPIIILQVILQLFAIISLIKIDEEQLRGPKWLWIILIIGGSLLGPVFYFTIARRQF